MWNNLTQDLRYAFRSARRDAGFFAFAVLILGVGIGANTAIFSIVNPLLLRPLPFEAPERLVWIANSGEGGRSAVTSRTSNLRDFRTMSTSFEALTGYDAFFDYEGFNLVGDAEPERLVGVGVARNFLEVLGVEPALGRNFVEAESIWNGRRAVLLTDGFWRRRYAADPAVVGRSITLNAEPTTVVGVLPASFDFASTFSPGTRIDLLLPFPISDETDRHGNTLVIIGRLAPGATVETAQAELDLIIRQLEEADESRWGLGAVVSGLQAHITGPYRRALYVLGFAVGLVMLIACANLSNLLLARGSMRRKEMAVRSALGAGRARMIRQMLTESLLLASSGALFGIAVAYGVTRVVASTSAVRMPLLESVALDGSALLFTVAIALAAGIAFGLVPALTVVRGREAGALGAASRGSSTGRDRTWVRDLLVVTEVAVASILLVGAGLLLKSFVTLLDVELGFRPEGVVAWEIEAGGRYPERSDRIAFHERVAREVRNVPGVTSVGMSDTLPLGRNRSWGARAKGKEYEEDDYESGFPRMIDSGYLETMNIPLVAGRNFTGADTDDKERIVIINASMAKTLWPERDAIGQTLLTGGDEWRVVGIVGDVRHSSLEKEAGLEMYMPFAQAYWSSLQLVVRSELPPESLVRSVQSTLRAAEPSLPTGEYQALDALIESAVSPRRFILLLLGVFAMTALLLASLGIYGVLSYAVSQQAREIGIRMALGASARLVQWRVVKKTLTLAGLGILLGWLGSLMMTRSIASLLYGVEPADPATFALTVLVLLAISGLAAYLPSRRASRIEPVSVLRLD